MRSIVFKYVWAKFRDVLLDIKGFKNNTIHNDRHFLELFKEIYVQRKALLGIREMNNIYTLAKQTAKIKGDIAEVGVYKGGSARILAECKGDRAVHLFDTFAGMPAVRASIDKHRQGDFADTSLESVQAYLASFKNIYFHKGYFPETTKGLEQQTKKFSFVNLDVDIYESTLNGLKYFYPKMTRGGVILSHDYRSISCPGVKQAYDEFFADKPEIIIELWDTQCVVIKQ
jgi:hypothetical protein